MTTITSPPTPRRCRRILEIHHLDCQGHSAEQIAEQLGCARSPVYVARRDFELHRAHVLRTVAADNLADQVHCLTQPAADPARHRQTVAATRELRLLLAAMPELQEHEQQERERIEAAREAPAIAIAHSRHFLAGQDGHARYIGGSEVGQCMPDCPRCFPHLYEGEDARPPVVNGFISTQPANHHDDDPSDDPSDDPDEPALIQPEPEPDHQFPDESGQNRTNLDEFGQEIEELPVPSGKSSKNTRNSRPTKPPKPVGREYPVSWDNPFGYIPRINLIREETYTPMGGRDFYNPHRRR
ncbi:MAG: hypothetical protein OXS30_05735 [Chloroflexota bacterium]|nr:hypothetical protein [Chloroflexota bacterium]